MGYEGNDAFIELVSVLYRELHSYIHPATRVGAHHIQGIDQCRFQHIVRAKHTQMKFTFKNLVSDIGSFAVSSLNPT